MSQTPRTLLTALAACAVLLSAAAASPGRAVASPEQRSIMMDDDLLVYRDDATRDRSLRQMKALGVDTVRVTLLWSVVAEDVRSTKARGRRFDRLGAANPRAYPAATWDRYDRLARAVRTLGMQLYFNVTGPGPAYGHTRPPRKYAKDAAWWRPKPTNRLGFFTATVATPGPGQVRALWNGAQAPFTFASAGKPV